MGGLLGAGDDQLWGTRGQAGAMCQHFPLTLGLESSQTVPSDSTATDIVGLRPGTSYQVAVSALRGREEGPPAVIVARTGQGLTRPLGALSPVLCQTPMASLSDPCFSTELQSPALDPHCLLPQRPCFPLQSPVAPPKFLPSSDSSASPPTPHSSCPSPLRPHCLFSAGPDPPLRLVHFLLLIPPPEPYYLLCQMLWSRRFLSPAASDFHCPFCLNPLLPHLTHPLPSAVKSLPPVRLPYLSCSR